MKFVTLQAKVLTKNYYKILNFQVQKEFKKKHFFYKDVFKIEKLLKIIKNVPNFTFLSLIDADRCLFASIAVFH